jgi:hypothetical protein
MTSANQPVSIDPNFFLPPNVVDMRYVDIEGEDTSTQRDDDGEIVGTNYDDVAIYDFEQFPTTDSASSLLSPPDTVTFVSQTVRVAADGKFVVDLIIDVEDVPGVVRYDVSLSKP